MGYLRPSIEGGLFCAYFYFNHYMEHTYSIPKEFKTLKKASRGYISDCKGCRRLKIRIKEILKNPNYKENYKRRLRPPLLLCGQHVGNLQTFSASAT